MQQPWEAGWQSTDSPAPQSQRVDTKIIQGTTYHLWKNQQGVETIQKEAEYFRVSAGAFNTIPTESHLGLGHGVPKHQT